jgi:hypothetical protein
VSEQPFQSHFHNPSKDGTVFEDIPSADYRIDLHVNTVPNYDQQTVEAGRQAYERKEKVAEVTPIELASKQLRILMQARDGRKQLDQTDFLKDDAA